MLQVISSGIGNSPPPGLVVRLLNYTATAIKLDPVGWGLGAGGW